MVTVYAYWDKGIEGMPPMIRHIYDHNVKMAMRYKFEYTLVTDESVYSYISTETLPPEFWLLAPNFKSDIVRYLILHRKGGIWLDTDIIIIKDLNVLYDTFLKSDKDLILDTEHHTEIGCASLVMKPNTVVSQMAVDTVLSILKTKGTNLAWGDLGPLNIQNIYRTYSDRIILNSYETVKKGCNYICYDTRPGYNHSDWYLPTSEDAAAIAQKLIDNTECYYIVTWTIYSQTNVSDIKQMVFDDSRSIFYQIIRLASNYPPCKRDSFFK